MYRIYADNLCIFDDAAPEILNTETESWSEDVNLSAYSAKQVYIDSNGKWKTVASSSAIRSKIIPITARAITLTLTPGASSFYTLLTSDTYSNNGTPSYATGYTGRDRYTETITANIPSDAKYVWIYTHTANADITPSKVTFSGVNQYTVRGTSMVNPKLTLTAGAAGSLTFTLPKGCTGYDTVQKLTTTIRVERDWDIIWMGRVLTEKIDLWGNRELFCEGALAFLNDTIPMVTNPTLSSVLTAHNGKVAANRQITLGNVAQAYAGGADAETDGSTSLEIVNSKLVGSLGGILQMRYPSNVPTLDWLAAYPTNVNAQKLEFGKNLLDFTRNWDLTEYSTYCYVQGAEYETTVNDQTVKQNYNSGWQYITPQSGTAPKDLYGRIEKYLNYSDLQSDADCVAEAQKYLATQQFDNMMIELTALDLHIIDPAIRPFNLLEIVSVSSWAHGMAPQNFAVTAMDIPLDAPENTRYTLANATLAYTRKVRTITKVTQQNNDALNDRVDEEHAYTVETAAGLSHDIAEEASARQQGDSNTLQEAKDEIASTMNKATKGYIFIDYNDSGTQGIYITDSPITSTSQITSDMHVWKWTASGFGYSNDGGQTYEFAADMQGRLNANMILTGLMLANRIKLYGDMSVYDGASDAQASGWLGYGAGHNGLQQTNGIHMYVGTNEVICTGSGVRISCGGNQIYVDGNGASINCPLNGGEPLQIGALGNPCDVTILGNLVVTGTINGAVYPPAQS